MSNYRITINGMTRDVTLLEKDHTRVVFLLDGKRHEVEVAPTFSAPVNQPASVPASALPAQQTGQNMSGPDIYAPMPGVIVSVDVAEGDTVTMGQRVCVMEAMKMENNIAATTGGVVTQVLVSAGEEVQNQQILIRIQPAG